MQNSLLANLHELYIDFKEKTVTMLLLKLSSASSQLELGHEIATRCSFSRCSQLQGHFSQTKTYNQVTYEFEKALIKGLNCV